MAAKKSASSARLPVQKTFKLYIGGKFPRTESGRYYKVPGRGDKTLANACLGSRKDLREAVVAARAASAGWQGASEYLRSQILYRIAEMLEGRAEQFATQLIDLGATRAAATREVASSIDRLVYFAGWCDKLTQVFGSVNPVATAHYNFSTLEATGVVGIIAPDDSGLLGLISVVAPAIAAGNTCVVMAQHADPLSAMTLAEVLHASDVPGGVVNILTGNVDDVALHMARHKDIDAVVHCFGSGDRRTAFEREAAINIKTVVNRAGTNWRTAEAENPYVITDLQEVKTTWHPVGL